MAPTGILKPDTSPRDGIFNPNNDPIAHSGVGGSDLPEDLEKVEKLIEAHTTPIYLAFVEHPQLRGFIREFMGWKRDVMVQRTLLRFGNLALHCSCFCITYCPIEDTMFQMA